MHTQFFWLIAFVFSGCLSSSIFKKLTYFDINETPLIAFVEKQGYKIENYRVETEDGYILTYHRIWPSNVTKEARTGYPVLLQHGLGTSSAAFLIPNKNALAYVLADAGYDVWLANSRGNRYSHSHKTTNSTSKDPWHYSLHELGMMDLAAGVDRVLSETGWPNLALIGHSHGATKALVLVSSRPSYHAKISFLLALAPTVFLGPGHKRPAEAYRNYINRSIKRSNLLSKSSALSQFPPGLEDKVCLAAKSCLRMLRLIRGTIDTKSWSIIQHFQPAGAPEENLQELIQQIQNGPVFKRFDYGPSKNIKIYKTESPPEYDLSKVNIPVHVFFAENDVFITPEDIQTLAAALPKPNVTLHLLDDVHFNHFDFLWSPRANSVVYKNLQHILKQYSGSEKNSKITKPNVYAENSSKTKLLEATERFIHHLQSFYNFNETLRSSEKVNRPYSSANKPNDKGMEERKNNFNNIALVNKQIVDNDVMQYMYDEVNTLVHHLKYLETEYKISIKVTNDHVIVISNFDKLWEKSFIKNECNQNCKDIFNNLKHLTKYDRLLNQPHVEVFDPKYIIETNYEFYEHKLARLFNKSVNDDKVDLTSGSVKEAVKGLSSNVFQARVLVVGINDIYHFFSKLLAHKKYLNSRFDVQITGNTSTRLEIANFYNFLEYPYFLSNNCTFHCREMRLVKDHLSKYSSLLTSKIIKIDNPSSYMDTTVLSILMRTEDGNNHSVDSLRENVEPDIKSNISVQEINDLKIMLQTSIKKDSIQFTNDNVQRILQSTEYSLLQKTLLRNSIQQIYKTFKKLTRYKDYINSVYKVGIMFRMDSTYQQVIVENFEKLWYDIFSTENLCSKECLEIKKELEKISKFKDLLLKRIIKIDNPNADDRAEGLLPNIVITQPKEIPEAVTADNLMDSLTKYLIHIRRNYDVSDNSAQVVKSDLNQLKLFIFKLNTSQTEPDPYLNNNKQVGFSSNETEVTQDLMTQLEKYLTYIRFTYGSGSSKLLDNKVDGYDQFLKTLNEVDGKCAGVCEENRDLIEKVCKFQKHLHNTYFNNASKWLTVKCDNLHSDTSINANNSIDDVLSKTTQPPYIDTPTSDDKRWTIVLFNNNESKGFINLTSSTINEIYTNSKTSKAQKIFYTKIIYKVYDVMQSLWMYKDYLKSTYGVIVSKTETSGRISIENFHNLWVHIYKPDRKCIAQCKLVKLVLDKVKIYEEFLKKGVVMDNPQTYLDKHKGDIKTVEPLPEIYGRLTQDNVTLPMINIENTDDFITQLEKYLTYIRDNYGLEGSKLANKINGYIRLLKMLHDIHQPLPTNDKRLTQDGKTLPMISIKNTNDFITQLEKYLTYIRLNLGSIQLANKVGEYIRFLKTLHETKSKCAGLCNDNVFIKILCKFRKFLKGDTYFNNNLNRLIIKCDHLRTEIPINTNNGDNVFLRSTTQPPLVKTPKNLNKLWMLLFNNTEENHGIVDFTLNRMKKIFTNIKTSDDQKKIYTRIIHKVYDVMQSLWMYKDYLKSTYGVVVKRTEPFKRISIENFQNLWIQVYNQTKKCISKCKIIKFILDKVKAYQEFLRKGVVIDNPHAYLGTKNGEILTVQPLPLIIREHNKNNKTMPIKNTKDMDDTLTDLEMYLAYIKVNYGLEGTKLAYKDVGGIDMFLKNLNEIKGKCAGLCKENRNLINNICRFQTHLHGTYFSNTTNWMATKCDNVRRETSINSSNNGIVSLKNTTQPPHIETPQTNNNRWMLLFKNTQENKNGVVDFTSNSIKEIFTNIKTSKSQKKIYTKIIQKTYDVMERLWMYKDYLKSTYDVIVTKMEPSKRISIENFHNLWIQVYNQAKKCFARCKVVRLILDKVKAYEEFLRKGVVIDNPQAYLDTKKGDIKSDKPLPTNVSVPTQFNITLSINNTKGKDDILTSLETYLTYMRVYYSFGGSKLANKDVGGIDRFLKELHENKGKCAGLCEENRALIEKVCKFQKHLQDTYFNNNFSVPKTTCEFLYPEISNSKEERISNQSTIENKPSTTHRNKTNDKPVSTYAPLINELNETKSISNQPNELQNNTINLLRPLFYNNISKHFIDLSRQKVKALISSIPAVADVQRHLYVDTIYETYNALLKLEKYKAYLMEHYNVEFTRTPQSRIVVLNIKKMFESIFNDKPCTGTCYNIKSVIKTLEKFKNIFVFNTFIQVDYPSSYIDKKTGLIKSSTNDNSKHESSQYSLDVVINSLEDYLIQLSKTTVDMSESQFSLDVQRTYKLILKLNKLKKQGIVSNDEIHQLYKEAQQLKNYLKETYSLSFTSNTIDNSAIDSTHQYSKKILIVKSFLFQTKESSQVVDLTKRSVDGKLKGLSNRFEFQNLIRVAVSGVYKIIQKLILYEDYLRTHYNINITMNNPDELIISNFSHIFSNYNESTTPCKGDCTIIRSILEELYKYKSILNGSILKIDKPSNYAKPTTRIPNAQYQDPGSNPSIVGNLSDITTNLNRFLVHLKRTYNINSKDSKSATDVRYINQLLQDINNIKQKCTGNCIEGQRLLRRVSMFQKHLNDRYYLNNNLKIVQDQDGQIVEKKIFNTSGKGKDHVKGQEPKPLIGKNNKPVSDRKKTGSKLSVNVNINSGTNDHHSHDEQSYDSDLITNVNKFNNHVKSTYNLN